LPANTRASEALGQPASWATRSKEAWGPASAKAAMAAARPRVLAHRKGLSTRGFRSFMVVLDGAWHGLGLQAEFY
jgi:hypothetical protein